MQKYAYARFFAMIATSMFAMYVLTYFNTYEVSHVRYSETRLFMTLIMGGAMAIIMLSFMLGMYENRRVNFAIYGGAVLLIIGATWLVRSQSTVGDVAYMKAMIPHHSIAILTSERARISDPRVRELADGIIASQKKEIAEMEALIRKLDGIGG